MQPVENVRFGGAAVEIEEQQVHIGVKFPHLLLYSLGNDVVGDAGERLQTDDVLHTVFRQGGHLRRNQPSFAEVGRHVDDTGG